MTTEILGVRPRVYVLTTGDYSDLRVRAVFADRGQAEKVADDIDGNVLEFDLLHYAPPAVTYWERSGRVHLHWAPDPTKVPHYHTMSEGDPDCQYCVQRAKVIEYGPAMLVTWYAWDGPVGNVKMGAGVTRNGDGFNISVRAETEARCDKVYQDEVARAKAILEGIA